MRIDKDKDMYVDNISFFKNMVKWSLDGGLRRIYNRQSD